MGIPFYIGFACVYIYAQLMYAFYGVSYNQQRQRDLRYLREILVVYRGDAPQCVGALHSSGKILAPASCVEGEGKKYVAFFRDSDELPRAGRPANRYEVSATRFYPKYAARRNIGFNLAVLDLGEKVRGSHHFLQVDLTRSENFTRLGWAAVTEATPPKYCNKTMYDGWFSPAMSKCGRISTRLNITYPLGYVDITAQGTNFYVRSFNAPAAMLNGELVSVHTYLALFHGWIESLLE